MTAPDADVPGSSECVFSDPEIHGSTVKLTETRIPLPCGPHPFNQRDADFAAKWIQNLPQLEGDSQPSPKPVVYSPSVLLRSLWSHSCAAELLNHHSLQISSSSRQRGVASFESIDLEYVGNDIGVGPGRQ